MRKISKSNLSLFALLSLLVLFSSCTSDEKDETIINKELIELTLNAPLIDVQSKGRMTKTASTYSEDRVDHIDIFITDRNGNILSEVGKQRFTASQISNNKIALRTNPAISPQNFYVVANAPSNLTADVQTVSDLKRIRHGISAMVSSPFIMTGETEGVNVQIPSPKVNIQLQRTMARIDIKSATAVTNFEIVNVELRNTSDVIYMFPRTPVDYMGSLVDFKTPIPATDSKSVISKVYAFESFNPDLNDLANTTCIIVAGYYNGDRSKLTYYRIDVLGNDNTARIWRGACYTLNINQILGKGWDTADDAEANKAENIIYKINPWIDDASEVVFDGTTYLKIGSSVTNSSHKKLEKLIIETNSTEPITISVSPSDITPTPPSIVTVGADALTPPQYCVRYGTCTILDGIPREGVITFKIGRLTLTHKLIVFPTKYITLDRSTIEHDETAGTETITCDVPPGMTIKPYIDVTVMGRPFHSVAVRENKYIDIKYHAWTGGIKTPNTRALKPTYILVSHESGQETRIPLSLTQYQRQFNIATSSNSLSVSPTGSGTYVYNNTCTVTAPQNIEGNTFLYWEENGTNVSSSATYTFTVTGNRNLRAIYDIKKSYYIAASTNTDVNLVQGTGAYDANATCALVAPNIAGYTFSHWEENGTNVSSNTTYTFTVTANRSLRAIYNAQMFTLTLTATEGGTVSGGGTFPFGTLTRITAFPFQYYFFDAWYENSTIISRDADYYYRLASGNKSLQGRFYRPQYTITATATEGGTVSGGGIYLNGSTCTLTAQANRGFQLIGMYNPSLISSGSPYSFTVTNNENIEVRFKKIYDIYTYKIEAAGSDGRTKITFSNTFSGNVRFRFDYYYTYDGGSTSHFYEVSLSGNTLEQYINIPKRSYNHYNCIIEEFSPYVITKPSGIEFDFDIANSNTNIQL